MFKKLLIVPLVACGTLATGIGSSVAGILQSRSLKLSSASSEIWNENFDSLNEGDIIQESFVAKPLDGYMWMYADRSGGVSNYYDVPAPSHSSDFKFSYLAKYSNEDFYNYVVFRGLGAGGADIEFSIHTCSAIYTSIKENGIEIDSTKSWEGVNGNSATGYYGANEYNSITFLKKNKQIAIYINGAKTSWYTLDEARTPTSILFAEYGSGATSSYYKNFIYENYSDIDTSMPEFEENFGNYFSTSLYRRRDDNQSFSISSNSLVGNGNYNIDNLALPLFTTNSIVTIDANITSKPEASGYVYTQLSNGTTTLEFTVEINSSGSWVIIKNNGEQVYHSGQHEGKNPEIDHQILLQVGMYGDHIDVFVNHKLCGSYNQVITDVSSFMVCQYQLGNAILIGNIVVEERSFLVTYDWNDGQGNTTKELVKIGKNATGITPTRQAYIFDGWYLNDVLYDFTTPVTNDITLVAHWRGLLTNYSLGSEIWFKYQYTINSSGVAIHNINEIVLRFTCVMSDGDYTQFNNYSKIIVVSANEKTLEYTMASGVTITNLGDGKHLISLAIRIPYENKSVSLSATLKMVSSSDTQMTELYTTSFVEQAEILLNTQRSSLSEADIAALEYMLLVR